MPNKINRDSPLIKSVLALDSHLAELVRVGTKINSTDLMSDFDFEYIQKLMTRFAECGQSVSEEVTNLSRELLEARMRAEAVTQGVSDQAGLFNRRRDEQTEKLERFRVLGQKVGELNAALSPLQLPQGQSLTDEARAKLTSNIPVLESQLDSLIEELQDLRKSARDSRMKTLEKNAESLAQSLEAVRARLRGLT